ncbi:MAG: site-2 protease family protein [Oscillospiraceae bacterium]|nr:site-2 protease family protein [Oscillospiraceae bacterium]
MRFLQDFTPTKLLIIPAALIAIIFHELSHGLVAYWLGDKTAQERGRLSFKPWRHIDPLGLVLLIVAGFGWAKPVPVDLRYFKKPRRDFALVGLAGPVSNFLLALLALFLYFLTNLLVPTLWDGLLEMFFLYLAVINIGLGVFNLFPIPPLDGSKVAGLLIPDRMYYRLLAYERYGMALLALLLITDVLDVPLGFLTDQVLYGLSYAASRPFVWLGLAG